MSFNTRDEFTSSAASNKMILVHLHANTRLYSWTLESGSIYRKTVPHFVTGLKQFDETLSSVNSLGAVVEGSFYYDIRAGIVYAWANGSVDPSTVEMIGSYRFFFASSSLSASWNLTDTGLHTQYIGRIKSAPGYSHKVGIEQELTSLVGSGSLKLHANDGGLDNVFDNFIFENQECFVYSWNPDLQFDQSKLIYRGRVTNKSYSESEITFTIKDQIFDLEQTVPQNIYTEDDNVNSSVLGKYKRWIFGRVDGLQLQSIDQIGEGYTITGTVTGDVASTTLTGTGTLFLSELSPGDKITIGTQEFTVESITDNLTLVLDDEIQFSFVAQPVVVVPAIPVRTKNREFLVADHACATLTMTVVSAFQLNRVVVDDTTGIGSGDFVEFQSGQRVEVKNVAPGNVLVLRQNLLTLPAVGSSVIRRSIQNVYVNGRQVEVADYTVTNLGAPTNSLTVTLDQDVEFNLARTKTVNIDLTFTNGSRVITGPVDVDLREVIETRDYLRPQDVTYTTFYEVLAVDENQLTIRVPFAEVTITDPIEVKLVEYIGDDTIVSANVIGKTEDGEPAGRWIRTASQAVKSLISDIGISNINTQTFDRAEIDAPHLISLALPRSIGGSITRVKDAVDLLNKSVNAVLTLDGDLNIQYRVLDNRVPLEPRSIKDSDVIDWKIKTTNGNNFTSSIVKYRFVDVDRDTLEEGNQLAFHTSDFVRNYVGTNKSKEFNSYIYNSNEAQIIAERYTYFNRLGRSDVTIKSDLRLEDVQIGDVLKLEFDRLYTRFGGEEVRQKLVFVVGVKRDGTGVELEATDLGNTFNTSAVIAPNTTADFDTASIDEKLKYGFITDSVGIVDSDETTANTNLIS